ncbi:acyltransferase family protein [Mucilaginibacter ginkgonis]|uniref:Acyltransferase n=1 Tax=Mucilaginibacter ginkgonis TaxID=2682091 RepID=A0A6I4I2F8_9SPHI|nr:acyltransferase [Mucilaginibacter ginkgonis]QQL49413.1 acyltransferase [Mucilaginibacter ginkgonis]
MKNLVNETPTPKRSYAFVDAIRCIAMISIVMEHATTLPSNIYHPKSFTEVVVLSTITQIGKFGTVCFFLLAGFLIGEKFTDYTPVQYLKRRLNSTFLPWLIWSGVFFLFLLGDDIFIAMRFNHGQFDSTFGSTIIDQLKLVYLHSSFWFIPNFLICITLLLIFKKWLYQRWLGAIFLLFTCLYAINIYYEVIDPLHSTAIFGFVFFLWLGAQFNKHLNALEAWMKKVPLGVWIALTLITLVLGVGESLILRNTNSADPYNTLRLSNILYSMSFFFMLFSIREFPFTKRLKPRETTYGIYLLQFILVYSIVPLVFPTLKHSAQSLSFPLVLAYLLARFIMVYALAWGIVTLLNKTRMKWLTGN